mgnify:CR=1 FL=1
MPSRQSPWFVLRSRQADFRIRWYADGVLNASFNCLDRHLPKRANQTAIVWEPDDPAEPTMIEWERAAQRFLAEGTWIVEADLDDPWRRFEATLFEAAALLRSVGECIELRPAHVAFARDANALDRFRTRERLKMLYGDTGELVVEPNAPSGVRALLRVLLKRARGFPESSEARLLVALLRRRRPYRRAQHPAQ